jgi:hypothetical protein
MKKFGFDAKGLDSVMSPADRLGGLKVRVLGP